MRKFRIAYTIPSSKTAGSEKSILMLLDHINKELFDNVVIGFGEGPYIELLKKKGHQVTIIKRNSVKSLIAFFKLYRFLRLNKIDLLYECSSKMDALCARFAGIVVVERRNNSAKRLISRIGWIDLIISKIAIDKIIAVSNAIREDLIGKGIDSKKIVTIYNGVSLNEYNTSINNDQKKSELGIDLNKKIVSVVGRLTEQKGHIVFLEAVKEVTNLYNDTHFLIVGEGPLESKLKKFCKKMDIENYVSFLGFREDIENIYAITDIVVLPSLWEPLANVALEAMAAKKPLIATEVDGMAEAIIHNQTGVLVPAGNSRALSNAITELLSNKEKMLRLSQNGYDCIVKKFSITTMISGTEQTFLECLTNLSS